MHEKREFNFAGRWEQRHSKPSNDLLGGHGKVIVWSVGGILLAGALAISPWAWEYKQTMDLDGVNQDIAQLKNVEILWQKANTLKKQVQDQKQLFELVQKDNHDPGPLLEKLRQLLPPGTVVNSFLLQADSLSLGVTIPTPVDVARLWISLRDSKLFQKVEIQSVSLQDKAQTLNLNLKLK
ncbi:MAG: PilN domain-containing protein [Desulfitobacteriaceae bacterium]